MSNIKQIAQMAGVSRSTVSRVLNQHPHVHEDTRRKVQQIIDELDYIQNSNAVQLKKGRTKRIGQMICGAFLHRTSRSMSASRTSRNS